MYLAEDYEVYHCKTHKLIILYIKHKAFMQETQCWLCEREANLKRKTKPKPAKTDLENLDEIKLILGEVK